MLNQTARLIGEAREGQTFQAAGTFIDYRGRLVLVSVSHAIGDGTWFVETDEIDRDRGTLLLHLRDPVTFRRQAGAAAESEVAWCDIDRDRLAEGAQRDAVLRGATVRTYIRPLDLVPEAHLAYGFAKHHCYDY